MDGDLAMGLSGTFVSVVFADDAVGAGELGSLVVVGLNFSRAPEAGW